MKFKYKNLLVPAVMTALYGCGGGTDNDITVIENNIAPVLDTSALLIDGMSSAADYADGSINYMTSTYDNADGNMEWEFRFKESADKFPNPDTSNSEDVDFFEIDLLTGITDADNGSSLQVKDVRFVWEGPDCSSTIAIAPEYPEICEPILNELGLIDADGEIVNTTSVQEQDIRELQNLAATNEVIYGFQLKQTQLVVTPSEFAPILVNGQYSLLHIIYKVTDGKTTLDRRLKVVIDGEDAAPAFYQRFINSDEIVLHPDTGEPLLQPEPSREISEKSAPIRIDIAAGIYDQDIVDIEELKDEVGDLTNIYRAQDYTAERLEIIGITAPEGTPEGVFNNAKSTIKWSEEQGVVEYNVEIDPSPYADLLERGDSVNLEFTFQVSDGTNFVDRSFFVDILGADIVNPPEFKEAVLEQTMSTSAFTTSFDLKAGAIDLDGDNMQVVDFVAADGSAGYGVDLSNPNIVKVDPYGFLDLAPGEEQVLSYAYKLTDGALTSEERTLNITLTGGTHNLMHSDMPEANGFESGTLDGTSWTGGDGALSVAAEAAYSGEYGLNNSADGTFMFLGEDGINQGKIEEGDEYYINFFAKQTNAWGSSRVTFNQNGDQSSVFQVEESPNNGTSNWMEHTLTYVNADEFFQPDSTFGLSFRLGVGTYDDFSLVKFQYKRELELIPDGLFSTGTSGGWQVSGDATLAVTEEANQVQNTEDLQYGLEVSGGANGGTLYLDSSQLVQGGVKTGMRYIVKLALRNPTYVNNPDTPSADPSALLIRIVDEETGNWVRKAGFAEPIETAFNEYYYHLNTVSTGTDWNGSPYASDVNFDWTNAKVRLEINIPANQTFQIDNILMFPVPQ
ncbi:hypothetical protein [Paraglaciecola sp.]|uniref:hypothetical protein n=1 Tax=Paraglaciecola sp. TaxID=1920173 RepID=UPI003EF583D2